MCAQAWTTFTCGIQVVGIGVVAKHRVKVNVETLRVVWLLERWGACEPWWCKDTNCQGWSYNNNNNNNGGDKALYVKACLSLC